MKKPLWALGGALLLLLGLLLIREQGHKAALRPGFAFDTAQGENVRSLRVGYQLDSARLVRTQDGDWMTLPDSFPADKSRIRAALDKLLRVQNRERVSISTDSSRLLEFGLSGGEEKRVSWELSNGKRVSILLGKTSGADYSSMYWKFTEEPEVYRTPGNFTYDLHARSGDWKNRKLFPPFKMGELSTLSVDWIDSMGAAVHYKLGWVNDTTVRVVGPREADVPLANAAHLWETTADLAIDGFPVPGEERVPMGLDAPVVTVRILLKNGGEYALKAGPVFEGFHYARYPATPADAVVKLAEGRLDPYRQTVDQLLDSTAVGEHGPDDGHSH